MPRPHPIELRERVVSSYLAGEGTFYEIGARFKVGEASVNRWVNRLRKTGSLLHKPMGGARHSRLVDPEGELLIRTELDQTASTTLRELCDKYRLKRGVAIPPQTMSKIVARIGYTKKKGCFVRKPPSGTM
jgi:transposase